MEVFNHVPRPTPAPPDVERILIGFARAALNLEADHPPCVRTRVPRTPELTAYEEASRQLDRELDQICAGYEAVGEVGDPFDDNSVFAHLIDLRQEIELARMSGNHRRAAELSENFVEAAKARGRFL